MKRTVLLLVVGALMLVLAAGVALAALRVGNDQPNTLRGTYGDNKGQDTLLGKGAGDRLVGRSAADQLAGSLGSDSLYGNDGNDTLDGGLGQDRIFTGAGFDFVYAADDERDYINCSGEKHYRVVFDKDLDRFDRCPGMRSDGTKTATSAGTRTVTSFGTRTGTARGQVTVVISD
jgi:Ca2+-binding RTX toxin-like protein